MKRKIRRRIMWLKILPEDVQSSEKSQSQNLIRKNCWTKIWIYESSITKF